jgi:hypothetical protein
VAFVVGKTFVKVALKDADTLSYACTDTVLVDFYAPSPAAAFTCQALQQLSVATAKVEYCRAGLHQLDDFVVRDVRSVFGVHDETSRSRSCEIVERKALIIGACRSVSRRNES